MPERISPLFTFLYFLRLPTLFSLSQSVNIRASLYLSLCHSFLKEEGKTHILLLLLPLQIFSPFPLRKFPICLCAGSDERPSGVETVADAHTDWEAHSCMSSFTNTCIHICTRYKHPLISRDSDGPSVHTRRRTVDMS